MGPFDVVHPDPEDALAVLAFVLCPTQVFSKDAAEQELIRELMRPLKAQAIKRWREARSARAARCRQ